MILPTKNLFLILIIVIIGIQLWTPIVSDWIGSDNVVPYTPKPIKAPSSPKMTFLPTSNIQLPDLGANGFSLSKNGVDITASTTPQRLSEQGRITIHAYVWNYGNIMAKKIPYVWYDNNTVIKQGIIDNLDPNEETSVTFTFDTATYTGLHVYKFIINPERALPELTYNTNEMSNTWNISSE